MAVRRAADRLEATAARSGYRRRRQLDHPPAAEALVAAATERARDGDDDALRLLYLLYADNVFGYVLAIVPTSTTPRTSRARSSRACRGRSPTTG